MSKSFNPDFNLSDGDGFYQALVESHRDLSVEDSHRLNARLVLMMANQLGDVSTLYSILKAARSNLLNTAPASGRAL
jgi:Protein of unknown function (DUF2783)